ncbi:MAG: prepilin-type cleavage/methylation domain-containing protein, partial [Verrucomicrobiaceae bacterium]
VRVTLVALDESSAARIDRESTQPGVGELGVDLTSLFTNASQYSTDLKTLEQALQSKRLQYRVFTTEVAIPGAKWSR